MKTALTIAGSDPTGGAGLQADLKVFRSFNLHGLSVVSAVTVQNTLGVNAVFPVDKETFEKQLRILLSDIRPDAVKIGMLFSKWSVDILAEIFSDRTFRNIVIDPVTISSSGMSLVDEGTLELIRSALFPLSRVITPNIYEATVLTGIMIDEKTGMEEAAKALKSMGPEVVVITGGHLEEKAVDLYFDGVSHYIEGQKLKGEYHGTGCAFSSAVTALLALGHSPLESIQRTKEFVFHAIKKAYHPGSGMGMLYL